MGNVGCCNPKNDFKDHRERNFQLSRKSVLSAKETETPKKQKKLKALILCATSESIKDGEFLRFLGSDPEIHGKWKRYLKDLFQAASDKNVGDLWETDLTNALLPKNPQKKFSFRIHKPKEKQLQIEFQAIKEKFMSFLYTIVSEKYDITFTGTELKWNVDPQKNTELMAQLFEDHRIDGAKQIKIQKETVGKRKIQGGFKHPGESKDPGSMGIKNGVLNSREGVFDEDISRHRILRAYIENLSDDKPDSLLLEGDVDLIGKRLLTDETFDVIVNEYCPNMTDKIEKLWKQKLKKTVGSEDLRFFQHDDLNRDDLTDDDPTRGSIRFIREEEKYEGANEKYRGFLVQIGETENEELTKVSREKGLIIWRDPDKEWAPWFFQTRYIYWWGRKERKETSWWCD